MTQRSKYLWLTDTHLLPYQRFKMLSSIHDEKPAGVFMTGDMSHSGHTFLSDLEFIGKRIGRPFYFVYGNHDLWFSDIETVHQEIRKLCSKYKNLIWMTEAGIVSLNEEVAVIGAEGWYDVRVGNPDFIKMTFDWFLIRDFKKLPTWKERFEKFRELADESAKLLSKNLEMALETHKTVYLLSHYPAWKEANRYNSIVSENFWTPYNTNVALGKALEKVMADHKKRNLIVICGHTHSPVNIHVSRNIECRVGRGAYNKLVEDEVLYI